MSFIKIDTDLVGFYDNSIEVHTQFKDEIRETKNNISFFPKEYFELANSYDYCGKVNLKNDVCLIDSDLIIEEDIRFDNRVVIKEGVEVQLMNGADIIFATVLYSTVQKNLPSP